MQLFLPNEMLKVQSSDWTVCELQNVSKLLAQVQSVYAIYYTPTHTILWSEPPLWHQLACHLALNWIMYICQTWPYEWSGPLRLFHVHTVINISSSDFITSTYW